MTDIVRLKHKLTGSIITVAAKDVAKMKDAGFKTVGAAIKAQPSRMDETFLAPGATQPNEK